MRYCENLLKQYWKTREIIESSKAIKCPSVATQLVNMKKFQEIIQDKNIFLKYQTEEEWESYKEIICPTWSFENEEKH